MKEHTNSSEQPSESGGSKSRHAHLSMGGKGVAVIWLGILISMFVISLFYILFSYVLYSDVSGIAVMANNSLGQLNDTRAISTLATLAVAWQYWPLILFIGLIIFGMVASQKREPDSYYY